MSAKRRISRVTLSCLLVLIGSIFLLLMNGQLFTNRLIFLGFCGASALLWLWPALSREQRLARWIIGVHLVVMLATLVLLPASYEFQKEFNSKMEKLRAGP
ncbi:MAG TPA: hypothetical protein VMP01_16635 [Pirellulaceae bacterium]|nr:hypothetical protein [Pirellulaceae bacterium]